MRRYGYRIVIVDTPRVCPRWERIRQRLDHKIISAVQAEWEHERCETCGNTNTITETTVRAVITRDGVDTWAIGADSADEARQLANKWLDANKPGWRRDGAYENELA